MDDARETQARIERLLAELLGGSDDPDGLYRAALLLHRTAVELHRRARAGASQRRGCDDWGTWAGLQNLARNLVLQASTCRDNAAALAGRKR